jgi:tetratricopeptide (TPR) repeat protein
MDQLAKRETSSAEKRAVGELARVSLGRAVELDPQNAQAWSDRAYAAAIIAHEAPELDKSLGIEAEADARRALTQTKQISEFWLQLGVALDMQRRWLDAGDAFTDALSLAPTSARGWFYNAFHLSLNPVTLPLARAAVATCLRLDPSLPEAEALRRQLAAGP